MHSPSPYSGHALCTVPVHRADKLYAQSIECRQTPCTVHRADKLYAQSVHRADKLYAVHTVDTLYAAQSIEWTHSMHSLQSGQAICTVHRADKLYAHSPQSLSAVCTVHSRGADKIFNYTQSTYLQPPCPGDMDR